MHDKKSANMEINQLEICADSVQSAINAKKGGAVRIELCQGLGLGGLTPSFAAVHYCVNTLKLRTHVLIRPRSGSFCYNNAEYEIIKQDINICKQLGASAIVTGFLTSDANIDMTRTKEIVKLSSPMEVTFHRAFDLCPNKYSALEKLVDCGCTRVLTSGGAGTAYKGIGVLRRLKEHAENRILIMAGCGISSANAVEIASITSTDELHASCKKRTGEPVKGGGIIGREENNYSHYETDVEEVKSLIKILNQIKSK